MRYFHRKVEIPPRIVKKMYERQGKRLLPPALFPYLNTRTGWRPVRAVFLESSEWSSHKTIGL